MESRREGEITLAKSAPSSTLLGIIITQDTTHPSYLPSSTLYEKIEHTGQLYFQGDALNKDFLNPIVPTPRRGR